MSENTIAITMGDPAGIGPEIILKALKEKSWPNVNLLVVGSLDVIKTAKNNTDIDVSLNIIDSLKEPNFVQRSINIYDLNNIRNEELEPGKIQKKCGQASVEYIYKAIELAKNQQVEAVVTAPIHKEAIKLAKVPHAGHTEIFANEFEVKDYAMMLVEDNFRVIHVSTHVSLREACNRVKKSRIYKVIKLANKSLQKLGIDKPQIAVAGLNPHAGEHGLFGSEEKEEIRPAVEQAISENIKVEGPIPPDTVFAKARTGQYDMVVAMYHDQGHIPMKTIGFQYNHQKKEWLSVSGVNVTLGLPIVRTSVDHGVAFDIAGKNQASSDSMIGAIDMAIKMV